MNYRIPILQTVTIPSLYPNPNLKSLISPHSHSHYNLRNHRNFRRHLLRKQILKPSRTIRLRAQSTPDGNGGILNWASWFPNDSVAADKILRLISGATSSPICQFISSPTTFLHSVDARIKLVWLLVLVVSPTRSMAMRFGIVVLLVVLSVWVLPKNVWMDQLGRVGLLSGILFIMSGLSADGAPLIVQSRSPPPEMMGLPSLPASLGGYSYVIIKLGPLQLTRKGLSVASSLACLTFTIFQSASLCLATTAPEELASALRWFMLPLKYFHAPVSEITLTLLLSLRFINIVFDEVRYVATGIVSRRINWRQLTMMETIDTLFSYVRRIFKNIFRHAEQISQAMIVRGFRGDCNSHNLYLFSRSSIRKADIVSLLCLVGVLGAAILSEYCLI